MALHGHLQALKPSRRPLLVIRANGRAYLALNAIAYGLFLVGFVVGLFFPHLNQEQVDRLNDDGTTDLVRSLINEPWLFALVILGVNTLKMGAATIVVPSMIVPFLGVPLLAYWAFTTGITLVPASDIGWVALIPHSLTLVIEVQAYVLLMLGAYVLGRHWVWPRSVGADSRREAYVSGLRQLGWLSLAAFVLLVVGAVYEAFSLRYFVHPLAQWLL